MSAPVIPINRCLCVTCALQVAVPGQRECAECLVETRLANYCMGAGGGVEDVDRTCSDPHCACGGSGHANTPRVYGECSTLPQGITFVGTTSKTFQPVGYRPAPGGGTIPVFEDPLFATPRITEALPTSSRASVVARRVTVWGGLLLLWAFAAGWMFGRFG